VLTVADDLLAIHEDMDHPLGELMGLGYETVSNPFFLTIVGQSTFISAYCMLVIIARLQRFDKTQEEAALDLGASHVQVFWKVLIPFRIMCTEVPSP